MYENDRNRSWKSGSCYRLLFKTKKSKLLIVDRVKEVGENWINRYDFLVLFTPRMYDALPGLSFEGEAHGFPAKQEIVRYLKQYASEFDQPLQFQTEVIKVQQKQEYF